MTSSALPGRSSKDLNKTYLDGHLGFCIRQVQLALFNNFFERLAKLDLRPAEFSILCLIADNPGCRASDIAEVLAIKRPNFVPLLAGLELRNLVVRQQSEMDRRSHELFLTQDGGAVAKKAKALVDQQEAFIAAHLGEKKRAELIETLRQMERIDYNL